MQNCKNRNRFSNNMLLIILMHCHMFAHGGSENNNNQEYISYESPFGQSSGKPSDGFGYCSRFQFVGKAILVKWEAHLLFTIRLNVKGYNYKATNMESITSTAAIY